MTQYTKERLALIAAGAETSFKKRYALFRAGLRSDASSVDYDAALAVAQDAERRGMTIVTIVDALYPQALRELDCPPLALYCKGDLSLLGDRHKLAVVGTRRPTRYGKDVTQAFVKELCRSGCTIVSGLARGVDACAHRTALECGGRTIAVVATGLDLVYPAENLTLATQIASCGLIVGEYPPGTPPMAFRFPERNRIVSGLSEGVLISEAGLKSGSMITADCAVDQGRELFVVPGSIFAPQSAGCNLKLKELQACLVTCPQDIAQTLGLDRGDAQTETCQPTLQQQALLDLIGDDETHFADLLEKSGQSVSELSALLGEMELLGMIRKLSGNRYAVVPAL